MAACGGDHWRLRFNRRRGKLGHHKDQEHSLRARQARIIDGSLGPKREEFEGLSALLSFCGADERTTHHIIHTCVLFGPSRQASSLGISPHHTSLPKSSPDLFATQKERSYS